MTATISPAREAEAAEQPVEQPADAPRPASYGLGRLRITILLAAYVVVGRAAGAVFDQVEWALVAAPVPVTIVALLLVRRTILVRLSGAAASVVFAVSMAVVFAGGSFGDVLGSFSSGVQGLLSTDWPSPADPELVGTVAAIIATASAISADLAGRRRFHVLPLAPLIVAYVVVVALSSPSGVEWVWFVLLAAISIIFAAIRNDGTIHDRLVLLRGERRMIPLITVAVIIVALIAIPIALPDRADPRRDDPPEQTAPLLDPIETTLALRDLDPPVALHTIAPRSDTTLPLRWRTAALETYDGRRWSPNLTIRPIGRTLGPVTGPVADASVRFLDESLALVPLAGAPVSVDAPVETDPDRTIVRLLERPDPDDEIGVVSNLAPETSDAIELGVVARVVDESSSPLTDLAEALAGDGSEIDQLTQLETTLRDEFVLDPGVQGGGLPQALIDRFLRDTQRGTEEQFAAGFVLLARSLGVEARIATGFIADPAAVTADGDLVLDSSAAAIWPEVQLSDGRWLAFDPVPLEVATDGAPPPPEPQVQTPAAPQPPIAPPPEPDNETTETGDTTTDSSTSAISTIVGVASRVVIALGIVLLPFILFALVILAIKRRRRKRRLGAADPRDRIRGAWATATDAFVDAGLGISRSTTDAEIAGAASPLVAESRREVRRLASLSSAATFGSPEQAELLADDARSCLGTIESSMSGSRTRPQRLRWRLSLRSLRPATRSPVLG